MKHGKNNFYRTLRLPTEIFDVIKHFNNIKKKMLGDLDAQGYHRRKKEK